MTSYLAAGSRGWLVQTQASRTPVTLELEYRFGLGVPPSRSMRRWSNQRRHAAPLTLEDFLVPMQLQHLWR